MIVGVARVAANGLNGVPTLYTTYNRAIQYFPGTRFTISYILVQARNDASDCWHRTAGGQTRLRCADQNEFNQRITNYYTYQTGIGTNILLVTVISLLSDWDW